MDFRGARLQHGGERKKLPGAPEHGLQYPQGHRRLSGRARPLHRARDQAAREQGRQHPILRPPARGGADRLGSQRPAEREVGSPDARGASRGRQGGALSLPAAKERWRQGGHQSRHGHHPRASRGERPWPAQRPADRAFDRRQQCRRAVDAQLRHRGPEEGMARRYARRHQGLCIRYHRAGARLRRHPHGHQGGARRQRLAHQRRKDLEHRHPQGQARPDLRPHQRQGRRRRRHHRVPGADQLRRLQARGDAVDLQHADRPRPHLAHRCLGA